MYGYQVEVRSPVRATSSTARRGHRRTGADLSVVVAASRTRRQMVQRMGRVIRPKGDDRHATFRIVYARDTREDPATGAHEIWLDEASDLLVLTWKTRRRSWRRHSPQR